MKPGAVITLAAFAGLGIYGVQYWRGIDDIKLQFSGWKISQGQIGVRIEVFNPHRFFAYPIPSLFLNVFDKNSNYLGSLRSDNLQWISRNGRSYLYAWVLPNYTSLIAFLLATLIPADSLGELILNGIFKVGNVDIPFETTLSPLSE